MTDQPPEPPKLSSAAHRLLDLLGSLKLTLVILLLLLAGSAVALVDQDHMTWPMVLPLTLFALNLGCALITHPTFRRQTALLVFHLALIAVVLLIAASRLTYLKGNIEVTEGAAFDGSMIQFEAGPWHRSRLDQAVFENLGFASEYVEETWRIGTRNHVRWMDEAGRQQDAIIGDLDPLELQGYSFYTDVRHMGFAMVFTWLPQSGTPSQGAVHLPAYPAFKDNQQQQWAPPGSRQPLLIRLQFDEVILDPARPSEFRPPQEHRLLVQAGVQQHTLVPGDRLELADGTLVYEGLRRWMGYSVHYDWTIAWLLAACALAVVSMAWHYWAKFAARPWDAGAE